jgi:hypothetical protein
VIRFEIDVDVEVDERLRAAEEGAGPRAQR